MDTMGNQAREDKDLATVLRASQKRIEELVEGYFTTDSWGRRGGYAEQLVKELTNLLEIRAEVFRPLLRELPRGGDHLRRFDKARSRMVALLAELDDMTLGVGPRDVHPHRPERVVQLMTQFRDEVRDYGVYETRELIPFVEGQLDPERLRHLGERAEQASKLSPTHPHPTRPPADERSTAAKAASPRSTVFKISGNTPKRPSRREASRVLRSIGPPFGVCSLITRSWVDDHRLGALAAREQQGC